MNFRVLIACRNLPRAGYLRSVLVVLGLFLLAHPTELVFVRHGETQANATGHYNARTVNTFSEKGAKGVEELTQELLRQPKFDRIVVSPSPRALKTIAPYLRATHQKATIWPLLYECCTGHRPKNAAATRFFFGARIDLPKDIANLFIIEPGRNRLPVSPDYNSGLAQVQSSVEEFKQRFAGGRVLVVGHSGQGGHFLHALTGKWQKLENAHEYFVALP